MAEQRRASQVPREVSPASVPHTGVSLRQLLHNRRTAARRAADAGCGMTRAPDLEPHCGSWIATSGARVVELFTRRDADKLAAAGWRVETAAQYLGRVNAEIRAGSTAYNTKP